MTTTDILGGFTDGVAYKTPCRVATTGDLGTSLIGLLTIDGNVLEDGDRVLVWKQADATTNGIYSASSGAWSRVSDFNNTSAVAIGTQVYVAGGALYANTIFVVQSGPITFGETAVVFAPWQLSVNQVPLSALLPPACVLGFAGPTPPAGFLLPAGQSVAQATYPALCSALGATVVAGMFTLPDYRGRVLAGADNMGGSAAGRLTSYTLGTTGGEQTHTLSSTEMPAHSHPVTDPGHNHTLTDPHHSHAPNGGGNFISTGVGGVPASNYPNYNWSQYSTTAAASTGITQAAATTGVTTNSVGGGAAHNNVQPTAAVNWIIKF